MHGGPAGGANGGKKARIYYDDYSAIALAILSVMHAGSLMEANGSKKARIYYDDYSATSLAILSVMRGGPDGGGMEARRPEYIMMTTLQ